MIAYSPLLSLNDSQVAAYKIYVLLHPDTQEIFYVGQTIQDLQTRLSGHINGVSDCNKEKVQFIQELIKEDKKPLIQEVETIHGTCTVDKLAINEREIYWIKHYKSVGCKLLNRALMSDHAACNQYHSYLASLKRGETSWHYYYCGKTFSGESVYDERRLKADGFSFPQSYLQKNDSEQYSPNPPYDPWKNERFLKMMGYRKSYEDPFSYVPCYKDTNPDFYDDDY